VAKREYSFEVKDKCEALYVNEGKSLHEISETTGVAEVTLQRWSVEGKDEKEDWENRRNRYRDRLSKAQDETRALIREEILLQDLVDQKRLMDRYFEGRDALEKADIPMMQARVNLAEMICKILADMRKRDEALHAVQKIDRPQLFLDFMRDLVLFLKDRDPAGLEALEKNFDEFTQFAKDKYAN
jgi:transposase-like protein